MLEIAALVVVKKFRKMNARWRFPKFVRALSDDLSLTSMLEYDGERPILSLNERRLIVDQSRVSGRHLCLNVFVVWILQSRQERRLTHLPINE